MSCFQEICECKQILRVSICGAKFNPFSANVTKWSNTLKQFVGNLPTNSLSVFDHFVGLPRKGLRMIFVKKFDKFISNQINL